MARVQAVAAPSTFQSKRRVFAALTGLRMRLDRATGVALGSAIELLEASPRAQVERAARGGPGPSRTFGIDLHPTYRIAVLVRLVPGVAGAARDSTEIVRVAPAM